MASERRTPVSRPPWAWRLAVRVVLGLLRLGFGWRVRARRPEVIPPPNQPLVVVFNHTSAIDAFLIADTVWRGLRHWVRPLVKAELFEVPVIKHVARHAGAIPVHRGEGSGRDAAYGAAIERLREGGTVLIAPEGTITHDGTLLPLRHGAARLALEAGVDVLVVTHFGAQRGFSPVGTLPDPGTLVTMTMDVLSPWPDEDSASLTARIAATMIDRSEELQASYPQADPKAAWWPPYPEPGSPTATARENLSRYRESMAETVTHARTRMREMAEEHALDERLAHARERAEELASRSRQRAEELGELARERAEDLGAIARERAEDLAARSRERAEEMAAHARARLEESPLHLRERDVAPPAPPGPDAPAKGSSATETVHDELDEPTSDER